MPVSPKRSVSFMLAGQKWRQKSSWLLFATESVELCVAASTLRKPKEGGESNEGENSAPGGELEKIVVFVADIKQQRPIKLGLKVSDWMLCRGCTQI